MRPAILVVSLFLAACADPVPAGQEVDEPPSESVALDTFHVERLEVAGHRPLASPDSLRALLVRLDRRRTGTVDTSYIPWGHYSPDDWPADEDLRRSGLYDLHVSAGALRFRDDARGGVLVLDVLGDLAGQTTYDGVALLSPTPFGGLADVFPTSWRESVERAAEEPPPCLVFRGGEGGQVSMCQYGDSVGETGGVRFVSARTPAWSHARP